MPDRRDIVINTGPLIALSAAEHLEVLRELFAKVVVPYEVVQEVEVGGRNQFACDEFRAASWLDKRAEATVLSRLLQSTLDPVGTVCIDEIVGRRVARLHGLSVTGSLGILIEAKRQELPVSLRSAIERMRRRGIWLSDALAKECLQAAGE